VGETELSLDQTLGSTLLSAKSALGFRYLSLGLPIPTRVFDLLPSRESGERAKPHVDADFAIGTRVDASRNLIARKDSVPLARLAFQGAGLWFSFDGTMELDFNLPDTREFQPLGSKKPESDILGPSQAIVTSATLEARVARLLPALNAPEEVLKRPVYAMESLLKNLGVYFADIGADFLNFGKLLGLLVESYRDAELPGFPTLLDSCVVEFAANLQPAL
jgi:hypothetical protein